MKTLTEPTACAVCGGGITTELVSLDQHQEEWAYKVVCLNPECKQNGQEGHVKCVESA